jgi:hypothetical protein
MGTRNVVISQSIEIEIRATIIWPDPPHYHMGSYDEDPREIDEFKGVDHRDEHLLAYALEHGLLDLAELELQAIEAHDEMCRYEIEMDGYRLATRRMLKVASDLEAEVRELERRPRPAPGASETDQKAEETRKRRVEHLKAQVRGIRDAQARVGDWRVHEEKKARAVFREGPHEIEATLQGQDDADDPISEARLFIALKTSDRIRKALGKEVLNADA